MKKMMKLGSLILVLALLLAPSAQAASMSYEVEQMETFEQGVTVERTIVVFESFSRSSTKRATITDTYKNNGTIIATVSLDVTFGYDGSTSWVVSKTSSSTVYGGWSYTSEKISTSGGNVSLSATLKKGISSAPVSMSLVCSRSGAIS